MTSSSSSSSSYSASLLDSLYCHEDKLQWEDDDLISLLSKEQQICSAFLSDSSLCLDRREAVEWMLMVNSYFDFSTLTAILSINYLDRFLSRTHHLQQGKNKKKQPWMIQLAAVACLSLAAKFEEIHVPLLLQLQVEGTKYVFEAKTIQRMELLVLSTLEWKMNPVTPISFVDHVIRRLGLKSQLHWEFRRRCEQLLLSIAADWRMVGCLPSAVATATMMHAIHPLNSLHNHLLPLLNLTKEKVKHCYDLILEGPPKARTTLPSWATKRKCIPVSRTPNGVIDAHNFSPDTSNDSNGGLSTSYSPDRRPSKKNRVYERYMPLRVFVDTARSI